MPFDPDKPPSVAQKDELSELEDREIDFSDIPPLSEEALKNAIRNPYIRAQREGISVREAIKRSIAERDAHRSKHEKRKAS